MRTWQIPISLQGSGVEARAHFFTATPQKHQLTSAACGKRVNPGFSVPAGRYTLKCFSCRSKK